MKIRTAKKIMKNVRLYSGMELVYGLSRVEKANTLSIKYYSRKDETINKWRTLSNRDPTLALKMMLKLEKNDSEMKNNTKENKTVQPVNCYISHKFVVNHKVLTIEFVTGFTTIGSVNLFFDNNECIINSLHVDEKYRNQNVGTTLIKKAELKSLDNGALKTTLYVIKDSWMHNWYQRLGYSDTKSPCEIGYIKMEK